VPWSWTTTSHHGNTIAVGLREGTVPSWLDLYARAEAITKSMGLDLHPYVKEMERNAREEAISGYSSLCKRRVEQDI
jgi:spermidine synthase